MGKVTIDQLAGMMKTSFDHLEKEFKEEIKQFKEEVNNRFDDVETRLDKLENGHERRITKLEDDVRILKTAQEKQK